MLGDAASIPALCLQCPFSPRPRHAAVRLVHRIAPSSFQQDDDEATPEWLPFETEEEEQKGRGGKQDGGGTSSEESCGLPCAPCIPP